ncbi:histidine phosphatase family protein, partial [Klebsiella pneumoniae]
MATFRIDLLRHGESQYSHSLRGHLDAALTARGWQQMQ